MSFWSDFKTFAFKGNAVDLAVGVVIGAAFGKIVTALVSDAIMPIVSLVLPSGDWRSSGLVLRHAADPKNDVVLKYGDFAGSVLDFLIVALVLFLVVSRLVKAAEARFTGPAVATTREVLRSAWRPDFRKGQAVPGLHVDAGVGAYFPVQTGFRRAKNASIASPWSALVQVAMKRSRSRTRRSLLGARDSRMSALSSEMAIGAPWAMSSAQAKAVATQAFSLGHVVDDAEA